MVTVLDAEWLVQPSVTAAVNVRDDPGAAVVAETIRLIDSLAPGATCTTS